MTNYRTRDDDSLVPTTGEDGSTVWISSASSKPAPGVIVDRYLSPADFAQAIPCIVAALEERDWPQQHVLMLAQFWGGIMLHRYWNSRDLLAQRTIMLFQEEQRRAWHNAMPSSKGAWDISVIDEPTLARTFERVYRASLIRPDLPRTDPQPHHSSSESCNNHRDHPSHSRSKRSRRSPSQSARRRSRSPSSGRKASESWTLLTSNHQSGFQDSAHSTRPPAVCVVCLGTNGHKFIECVAERTWDNKFSTSSTCSDKALLV